MATSQELVHLFSNLAAHLQTVRHTSPPTHHHPDRHQHNDHGDPSLDLSLSDLTQSLNLRDGSLVRVLDTALSLMCFKAPQVFDSVIECSVKTIITVLTSSINCKVLSCEKNNILLIGSSISPQDCVDLVEVLSDVIPKLEGHGMLCHSLLHAVVRAVVSASYATYFEPSTCAIVGGKSVDGSVIDVTKLLRYLPEELSVKNNEIPLRLLFWYLDPFILKNDISEILQETMKRPFVSLGKEFYERMDWRSVVICLVLSPTMFIDIRALLHNWFLLTGLGFILELLIELVSVMLDVISRPMWWGMSIELASKLPFSNAYFPYKHNWLRTLAGPLSPEIFLQLVHGSKSVLLARRQLNPTIKPAAVNTLSIDHKSIWALAVSFPDWFYFASALLFSRNTSFQENFQFECTSGAPKIRETYGVEPPTDAYAAARYIAWILSPANKPQQDQLFDGLIEISECWNVKQVGLGAPSRGTAGYRKKFRKPKFFGGEEDFTENENDCQIICLWLQEFQTTMSHGNGISNSATCVAKSYALAPYHSVLLRRIPIGILIGCFRNINEDGFELLLHYGATGRIVNSFVTENGSVKHGEQICEHIKDSVVGRNESINMEAVAGVRLVFSLTDVVERMSVSFETEESGLEFICQVKSKAGNYLIKCIKKLTQAIIDEGKLLMLKDLHDRLGRWRHQGKEILHLDGDLDDSIRCLSQKLSI